MKKASAVLVKSGQLRVIAKMAHRHEIAGVDRKWLELGLRKMVVQLGRWIDPADWTEIDPFEQRFADRKEAPPLLRFS